MHTSELLFFTGFVIFIIAILLVDMLVIDRKAHEVSMKEAGIWTAVWIALALAFGAFLWYHGDLIHGIKYEDPALQETYRHNMAISYIAGYLIEKVLSVDNLFVMMMIFTSFGVSKTEYQHVLNWGIFGAIILRCIFIFLGSAIIHQFDWVLLIFGAFLLYSGVKMYLDRNKKEQINVADHPVVRFLSKHFRVHNKFDGDNFFTHINGKRYITPLFLTVIIIEFSDLIFAFDSIPAVFSVSTDPYIVFFSNIFAILGLRAMFFLLAGIADKFRFLKTGVSILLLFIGIKLLIHEYVEIDAIWSLVFIIAVLIISIVMSLILPAQKEQDNTTSDISKR